MAHLANFILEKFNEYIIEKSKIDLLKTNSNILYKLFHINIHFGNWSKTRSNSINNDSQLIYLLGDEINVNKAKKYIDSLCKPAQIQKISIKEKELLKIVENEEFRNDLIKNHSVHLFLSNDVLIIQGSLEDVFNVKYLIDMEETKLKTKENQVTSSSSISVEKMDDDDDVILIEPSQIFNDKKSQRKSSKIALNEMDVKSSIEKLNFIQSNIDNIDNPPKMFFDTLTSNKLKKDNNNDKLNQASLNEYATMFELHKFNQQEEKLNKVKRMEKLISAMSDEKKAMAINQVKAHSTRNNKKLSNKNDLSTDDILEEDKIIVDEPSLIIIDESDDETLTHDNKKPINISSNNSKSAPKMTITATTSNSLETGPMFLKIASDSNFININSNKNNIQNRNRQKETKPINFREMRSKSSNNPRTNNFNANKIYKLKNRDDLNQFLNNNSNMMRNDQFLSNNNLTQNPTTSNENNNSLRFIIIDGSNVAREHGTNYGKAFSCKGIKIVVDYFMKRGHTEIKALVPRFRRGQSDLDCPTRDPEILDQLEKDGYLTYTPSRYVNNKLICPYDDRFILKAAQHYNAIIVSNDNYRDLMSENYEWKKLVERNLLQYTFIGDLFMIADDPFGRRGPNIDEFLSARNNPTNYNNNNNNNMKKVNQVSAPTTSIINYPSMKTNQNNKNINNQNNKQKQQQHQSASARSVDEQNYIINQLKSVFPYYVNEINNLLTKYPCEQDVGFFASKLLEFNK